ncbi:MAG: hypothetical protein ABJJ37_16745 [Roseibium sp.]
MHIQSETPVSPSLAQQHAEATKRLAELSSDRLEKAVPSEANGIHGDAIILSQSIREQHGVTEIRSLEDAEPTVIRFSEDAERTNQLAHAEFQKMSAKVADTMQELIAYLEPAEPIPERSLMGEEAESARTRFKDADPVMTSTDGAKSFLENEMLYRISANGDVTVRHQLIPTSEERKQQFLTDLKTLLENALSVTKGRSIENIDRDIEIISKNVKAASAQAGQLRFEANASKHGQIIDDSI